MTTSAKPTRCSCCRRCRFVDFPPGSKLCTLCTAKKNKPVEEAQSLVRLADYCLVREKLVEVVLDGVFKRETDQIKNMSLLGRLRDTDVQKSPLLRYATEAVLFSQLAADHQGTEKESVLADFQQRAQRAYTRTLGQLARLVDMANPDAQLPPASSVLPAIMLMGYPPVCKQFKADSRHHQRLHVTGQYAYLQACGSTAFRWHKVEDVTFYRQLKWTVSLMKAVRFGPAMQIPLPNWKPEPRSQNVLDLSHETIRLPWVATNVAKLLLRVDAVNDCNTTSQPSHYRRLLRDLDNALEEISVPGDRSDTLPPSADISGLVNSADEPHLFDDRIEEYRSILDNQTFTNFYRFRPQQTPYVHEPTVHVAWLMQILLLAASLRLMYHSSDATVSDRAEREQRICRPAEHICRSVWHLSQRPGLAYARWTHLLLAAAETVFEQTGRQEHVAWTRKCREGNVRRIHRLLGEGHTSFCMSHAIAGKVAERCRWRGDE